MTDKLSERIRRMTVPHYASGRTVALERRNEIADEVAALEAELEAWTEKGALFVEQGDRLSDVEDALEHCGYDPTDCIDCGGPPHNKWCRFWKLRDVVPLLFSLAEEA